MDDVCCDDFSPAPAEEFTARWRFEFSRDGITWFPFEEYPQWFDLAAAYHRIRFWTLTGEEGVTEPSGVRLRAGDTEGLARDAQLYTAFR